MSMKKIYLASPYTHPEKLIRRQRFNAACRAAARLMEAGNIVFSPIAHSHPISLHLDNSLDLGFWMAQDRAFVDWCDELHVLMIPGWDTSKGVAMEIAWACEAGKPVVEVAP